LDFLHGVNDFKEGLKDFLSEFAQKGKVVKRENIEAFFQDLNERKKRKLEDESFNKNAFY
jgi:E3 ubiquitin-protein ligase UBR7